MARDEARRVADEWMPADARATVARPGGVMRVPSQPGHVHEDVVGAGVDGHPAPRTGSAEGLQRRGGRGKGCRQETGAVEEMLDAARAVVRRGEARERKAMPPAVQV